MVLRRTVLSLAWGGRRNPTARRSFIGALNYLFPSGQNNWGNCTSGCVNSLLHFVSTRHRILDPLTPDRTEPSIISERAGRFLKQRIKGCGGLREDAGRLHMTHKLLCNFSLSGHFLCWSRAPPEPVLTDDIQIWRPAQQH